MGGTQKPNGAVPDKEEGHFKVISDFREQVSICVIWSSGSCLIFVQIKKGLPLAMDFSILVCPFLDLYWSPEF